MYSTSKQPFQEVWKWSAELPRYAFCKHFTLKRVKERFEGVQKTEKIPLAKVIWGEAQLHTAAAAAIWIPTALIPQLLPNLRVGAAFLGSIIFSLGFKQFTPLLGPTSSAVR